MRLDGDVRVVGVFISSPGDVAPERGRAQAVAAKLNRQYENLVRFETVLWEEHVYKADQTFQSQIPESVTCDIVVSIFWTRIGTALPADFALMPNGQPYASGTAYELLSALDGAKRDGVPDVYVFRKTADAALPTVDAERRRQAQTQLDSLEAFWRTWFQTDAGQFKAAFQTFPGPDAFEQQFELLLRQWLDTQGLLGPRIAWPKEKGSPFPGLAAFEAEQSAVFFGRDRAIEEARRRITMADDRGLPFLLIVGASGAGKSSLARAGLLPRLTTPGIVPAVDLWRVARMKPGEVRSGPIAALAAALCKGVPELEHGDFPTPEVLADHLHRGGHAAAQPIVRALRRAADEAQRRKQADRALEAELVLLVDQGEELFAQAISPEERAAFAECLHQLVCTGRIWCVVTLRADLYEAWLREPALKTLKERGASLDLGPPGAAELAEIVREPAAAAGLVYETDADRGVLDERLLVDAKTADSLPLLQFTLRRLYEQRSERPDGTVLTHAAYDALGGLEGAIAAEAERAVEALPPASREALPRLLRHLAEPARDTAALTMREVPRAEVATNPDEAALVDALSDARILIARTDAAGRPTIRLAHDAVLASWPRAASAAQASRDFYRVRAEVEESFRRWEQHGRPKDRLIAPGVPLAEAERLKADFGPELPAALTAYIAASQRRAQQRQRLLAAAAVFFLGLAVTATGATIIAYRAQQKAVAAEAQAIAERDNAARNFGIARQTAETVVFDLARGLRNTRGMRAAEVQKILDAAKTAFDTLANAAPEDRELQRSRSVMLEEFGHTYLVLGDLDAAMRSFSDSRSIRERLVAAQGDNLLWRHDLSNAHQRIGDVLLRFGRHEDALKAYGDALVIAEGLVAVDGNDPNWQRSVMTSHLGIGDVRAAQGQLENALAIYGKALAIAERFAGADQNDPQWQRDLAVVYERMGVVLLDLGRLDEAVEKYRKDLEIAERLAAKDGSNTEWQRDLLVAHTKVGEALEELRNTDEALDHYRKAVGVAESLVAIDSRNTQWQRDLSVLYGKVGDMLILRDKPDEAFEVYVKARDIAETLAVSDRSNADWQRDLSATYEKVGNALFMVGMYAEALDVYRKGAEITRALADAQPDNVELQRDVSLSYEKIGDAQLKQGSAAAALATFKACFHIRQRLAADAGPGNTRFQRDLAVVHGKLAETYELLGDVPHALAEFRKGRDIMATLVALTPDYTRWQTHLAWFEREIARLESRAPEEVKN